MSEAIKAFLSFVIANQQLATILEGRAEHIPVRVKQNILRTINLIFDIFDPSTDTTIDTVPEASRQWINHILDGDPETGAVDLNGVVDDPLAPPDTGVAVTQTRPPTAISRGS